MGIDYFLEIFKILIPALVAIMTIYIARYFERKRDAELKIREKKILVYEEFVLKSMSFVLKSYNASEKRKKDLANDFAVAVEKFSKYILFWGSDKVIRTFNKYFKENVSNDDPYESMKKFEKFVLLLRMDIGQSNKALKKWDLIKMFIVAEDIDKKGEIIFDKK